VRYETVESGPEGLRPRTIDRPGPTGFITTTTAASLHPENETRLFTLSISDTSSQTREVLLKEAAGKTQRPDLTAFIAFQEWLEYGTAEVEIPFATLVAKSIPVEATAVVRIRRDFKAVLSLIRSCAIVHQLNRKIVDGVISACRCDYEIVRNLVLDVISHGLEVSVSSAVRETVAAVADLKSRSGTAVTVRQLMGELNLGRSAASRRATVALKLGFLSDGVTKNPKRYSLGDPMPAEVEVLPDADALGLVCVCAPDSAGIATPLSPRVHVPATEANDVIDFE